MILGRSNQKSKSHFIREGAFFHSFRVCRRGFLPCSCCWGGVQSLLLLWWCVPCIWIS